MRTLAFSFIVCLALQSGANAQSDFCPDTNGDGVVDGNDDTVAIEEHYRKASQKIRSTAPKTELVRGFYTTVYGALPDSLSFSYVHATRDSYSYYHQGMRTGFMEHGEIQLSDGWMRVKHSGGVIGEHYLHPHKLGGRDVLFTQQAWGVWFESKKLLPHGVFFRLEDADMQRAIGAVPRANTVFQPDNSDGLGPASFAFLRYDPNDQKVEQSDAPKDRALRIDDGNSPAGPR